MTEISIIIKDILAIEQMIFNTGQVINESHLTLDEKERLTKSLRIVHSDIGDIITGIERFLGVKSE